jgi:hypothetical protein
MRIIQTNHNEATYIIVIIEPGNLARMQRADPITLTNLAGGFLRPIAYPNRLRLCIAFEEHIEPIQQMVRDGQIADLVTYLERGLEFTPMLDGVRSIHEA